MVVVARSGVVRASAETNAVPPSSTAVALVGLAMVVAGALLARWWRRGERPEGDLRWPILIAGVVIGGVVCLGFAIARGLGLAGSGSG